MPKIKPYQPQIPADGQIGGRNASGSDFGGAGLYNIGQAVQSATHDLANAAAIIQRNKAQQEATDADLKVTLLGMDLDKELQTRKQNHRPGEPDFTESALEDFKNRLEQVQYNEQGESVFSTDMGQRTFATKAAHLAKQYAGAVGRVQAELRGVDAVNTFNTLTAAHSGYLATGQNYLHVEQNLREYEQSVRTGIFQDMPADQREELLRKGRSAVAEGALDGLIRDNPRGAVAALQGGFLNEVFVADKVSALLDKAQVAVRIQEAEDRHKGEEYIKAFDNASRSNEATIVTTYLGNRADPNYNPFTVQKQILGLLKDQPDLMGRHPEKVIAMIGVLDADIREAKVGATQGNADLDRQLFAKIAAGKLPDLTEINQARAQPNHPISPAQHEELVKEWELGRTPEGRSLQKDMESALKLAEPLIMPKDLTGVLADPESGLRMIKLTHDVRVQIDKDRRDKKDPFLRFNPDAPEYMFTPELLKKYQTPFLERIRAASARLAEQPGLPKDSEGGIKQKLQRRSGESILDYKKRTGQ